MDAELAFLECHASRLTAVVGDLAVDLLALLLGAGQLLGTHHQHGLDGGSAHDVDEVIDGRLGVFDEVEHGQEELTVLGEHLGELLRIESGGTVGKREDLVASRHRWWLPCKGFQDTR